MADEAERDDSEGSGGRSGRYPGVSLRDALAAAEKLYKAEKASPVDNETAAAQMGYKGLTGPARVMIGALRQYALIEKTKPGQFRLSKVAIDAIHGTPDVKAAALKKAALSPDLFAALAKSHLEASIDNVKSYLITEKGFIDTGARIASRAFRDTVILAKINPAGYSFVTTRAGDEDINAGAEERPMDPQSVKQDGSQTLPPLSWVLSVPRGVRAELRITGKDVRREDLARLKQQIDFLVESFDDGEKAN